MWFWVARVEVSVEVNTALSLPFLLAGHVVPLMSPTLLCVLQAGAILPSGRFEGRLGFRFVVIYFFGAHIFPYGVSPEARSSLLFPLS